MSVDITQGIVRILRHGHSVGTGFIVAADGMLVTCSHVVQTPGEQDAGLNPPDNIEVAFEATQERRQAVILNGGWRGHNAGDVAFLRIQGGLPVGVKPLRLGAARNLRGHVIHSFGYPTVDGRRAAGKILGPVTQNGLSLLQIESSDVTTGFSGAPVWDGDLNYVIGMVTSIAVPDRAGRMRDTAFLTPSAVLHDLWPAIPVWPALSRRAVFGLATLLTVIIMGLAALAYRVYGPRAQMEGGFRIAVAEFTVAGGADPQLGQETSQTIYRTIEQTMQDRDLGIAVTVWGPEKVGAVQGATPQERATNADALAKAIEADVIVYGQIDATEPVWQVTPEFLVSTVSLSEVQEIVGDHEVGQPVSLSGQGDVASRILLSLVMKARINALAWITVGLAYYSQRDYQEALDAFQTADEIKDWKADQGKEVLYLLMGNAAGKQKSYDLAEQYYRRSLEINPEYARPLIGLGSTYYNRALLPFEASNEPTDIDTQDLKQAEVFYAAALSAMDRPALADVPTKVDFGLGQTLLMQVYASGASDFSAAEGKFAAVISAYNEGANPRVRELAAESHARLGLIFVFTNQHDRAAVEYAAAADLLADNPERQAMYQSRTMTQTALATLTPP